MTPAKVLRLRKLADKLKQWDQDWARKSLKERDLFALTVGAIESQGWIKMGDALAHWLAGRIIATGWNGTPAKRLRDARSKPAALRGETP